MTGRQHEMQTKEKNCMQFKLNNWEKEQFNTLYYQKLSISRAAICQMMSFCFDKSAAALEISSYIHQAFLPKDESMTQLSTNQHINKFIARLYVVSDVLFNSQQPGVRNAFKYRETIQDMSHRIFKVLGDYKNKLGLISWNKLKNSVTDVLQVWGNWNVYHDGFLKELEDLFHYGKVNEAKDSVEKEVSAETQEQNEDIDDEELLDEDDLDGEALDDDDDQIDNDITKNEDKVEYWS